MSDDIRAGIAALLPRLRRFAHALAGNRDEGDDLVQAACLKALTRLDQFQPGTRLDSWMFRIVQTGFLDRARSRARRGPHAGDDAVDHLSDGGSAALRTEQRMVLGKVRDAISALPEEQRAVIALVAIEGFSYREAAEILDVPVGTVMSRLARARARLLPLNREIAS